MYAISQEAVIAELAYRRGRAADELHHTTGRRGRRDARGTLGRALTRRVGR